MNRFEKIIDVFSSMLLMLAGIIGVIIGIADFAGWEGQLLSAAKDPISLILVAVGILSLSLGLERVIRFRRLDQQLEEQKKLFLKSLGVQYLKGYDDVYNAAIRLCSSAQKQIRTVVFATSKAVKTPRNWANAVAQRLKETQKKEAPIKLDAVLVLNFENLPNNSMKDIQERLQLYEQYGIKNLAIPNFLDIKQPIGFDLFIIDREHAIIAFSTFEGAENLQSGILFENQPQFVSELADWFDQRIIKVAMPLNSWLDLIKKSSKRNLPPKK